MGPFGGWEMPISYGGILEEHRCCRTAAALFDICHMGEFIFRGDLVADGLDRAVTQPLAKMKMGTCRYGFILNEEGGIIDDLIVLRTGEKEAMLVVNAAPSAGDFRVLQERLSGGDLEDVSGRTAKIDVQGPLARRVLFEVLGLEVELRYFRFAVFPLWGQTVTIARAGYTGELGYEIYSSPELAPRLWSEFLNHPRVAPAGLGARDILRLEIGYSLYGHDIDAATTPLEADLGAFINWDKEFTGRAALSREVQTGLSRMKIAFRTESRRSPRGGHRIVSPEGEIGMVTSGCFSPMLSCGIGLGYVSRENFSAGEKLAITDGQQRHLPISLEELPFYREGSLRN